LWGVYSTVIHGHYCSWCSIFTFQWTKRKWYMTYILMQHDTFMTHVVLVDNWTFLLFFFAFSFIGVCRSIAAASKLEITNDDVNAFDICNKF
jgi:hypothetical protein